MAEFGYHTIGTGGNDNPSLNFVWAKAASTPGSNGDTTLISVYCAILAGSPNVAVALYSDSAGAPANLLAANDTGAVVGVSFGWVDVTLATPITSGTQYWFCVRCPGSGGGTPDYNVKYDTNGGATEGYFKDNSAKNNFPATATGATSFTGERWSIYATYTPSGGGRTALNTRAQPLGVNIGMGWRL